MTIRLERCAYHFVNKSGSVLLHSRTEQDLTQLDPAIGRFFEECFGNLWEAEDAGSIVSGVFADQDPILGTSAARPLLQEIFDHPDHFFLNSGRLADLLYMVSPTNASPGVLVLLLALHLESQQPYLALFKLKYKDESFIRYLEAGELPQLQVEQVRNMLMKDLQKGALVPHPNRRDYHLKVMDKQGLEPAAYFKDKFLGCLTKKSDEHQIKKLIPGLEQYAQRSGLKLAVERVPHLLTDLRHGEGTITLDSLVEAVARADLYGPHFSRDDFAGYLRQNENLRGFNVPADRFVHTRSEDRRLKYTFTTGQLEGVELIAPPEVLEQMIHVEGDALTFTIRTTRNGYQSRYE